MGAAYYSTWNNFGLSGQGERLGSKDRCVSDSIGLERGGGPSLRHPGGIKPTGRGYRPCTPQPPANGCGSHHDGENDQDQGRRADIDELRWGPWKNVHAVTPPSAQERHRPPREKFVGTRCRSILDRFVQKPPRRLFTLAMRRLSETACFSLNRNQRTPPRTGKRAIRRTKTTRIPMLCDRS